jgi:hypothetical protein
MSAHAALLSTTAREILASNARPTAKDVRAVLTVELAEYGILPLDPAQTDASRFLCGEYVVIATCPDHAYSFRGPHYGWSICIARANNEPGIHTIYSSSRAHQRLDLAADTAEAAFAVVDHFTAPCRADTERH